jgi:hypothetical protein
VQNGIKEEMKPGERPDFSSEEMPSVDGNSLQLPKENTSLSENSENSSSSKGILSEANVLLNSGNVNITSVDDAINTSDVVTINKDVNVIIKSGDDAIHADNDILAFGGVVNIDYSHEGLEAKNIALNGTDITIYAQDDGINTAAGDGQAEFEADSSYLLITDGTITIDSDGDGIDINGNGEMSGGTVYVYGAENSGNAAIDYNGTFNVNGGTLVAAGMKGMAQAPTSVDLEVISLDIDKAFSIEGTDISFESDKKFNNVVIVSEKIRKGSEYKVLEK